MCGRYTLTSSKEAVSEYFETGTAPQLPARYNLAPTQETLIVKPDAGGERAVVCARWGFQQARGKQSRLLINARCESAHRKPSFKVSFQERRCLVPANGFFEWIRIGRIRQPYYFTVRKSPLFGFAGLWSEDADGRPAFVILTTAANEVVAPVHDRMPVILNRRDHDRWLADGALESPFQSAVLRPWPASDLQARPVGMRVNDAAYDAPACLEPLPGPVDLFSD